MPELRPHQRAPKILHSLKVILDGRQRRLLLFAVFGTCVAAVLEMVGIGGIPAFVALLTERGRLLSMLPDGALTDRIRSASLSSLTLAGAGVLAAVFLVKNAYIAALVYMEARILRDVTVAVSSRLFRAYLYSPYTFHLQRNPAHLIRNISAEVSRSVTVIRSSMWVLRESLVLAVVFLLLILVDPVVSLLLFTLLGAAGATFYAIVRGRLTQRGELAQEHRGRQLQAVNQGLGSIKEAKILGRESYLHHVFRIETLGIEHHELYQRVLAALPRLFLEVIAVAAVLLIAVIFVLMDRPAETLLPVLALLAVAAVRLVPALNAISGSLGQIRYERPALDLVSSELELLEKRPPIVPILASAHPLRLQSSVSLRDVAFRYPAAAAQALRGVSLSIQAGEAVAFIGPSGAGKSTLVDVLLGLLVPEAGEVLVDGKDIHSDLASWQRQIGYVPQDIYLIDDTIRRNIAFGLPDEAIDEAAVARAVQAAQLDAFVNELPAGLNTLVGNRGTRLSGGQRQRIGIARALYHDPSVLVMDEATSALDNEMEHDVIRAINRLRAHRTIIMIAHRLTTISGCDRVFLVLNGAIADQGSYAELTLRHEDLRSSDPPRRIRYGVV